MSDNVGFVNPAPKREGDEIEEGGSGTVTDGGI